MISRGLSYCCSSHVFITWMSIPSNFYPSTSSWIFKYMVEYSVEHASEKGYLLFIKNHCGHRSRRYSQVILSGIPEHMLEINPNVIAQLPESHCLIIDSLLLLSYLIYMRALHPLAKCPGPLLASHEYLQGVLCVQGLS